MRKDELFRRASRAVALSCYVDFPSGLDWGQWCRAICTAAELGDEEEVARLDTDQKYDKLVAQRAAREQLT